MWVTNGFSRAYVYELKVKPITLFKLFPFKSTASGEVGIHGQHVPGAVAVATRPARENVMIPFQIMVDQYVLESTKTVILAINRPVQVTTHFFHFI